MYDHGTAGTLPPKTAGRHRWVVVVSYTVSAADIAAAAAGRPVHLDHENRLGVSTLCADCIADYRDAHGQPCSPDPEDR